MCGIIGMIQAQRPRGMALKEREENVQAFVEQMLYMDALRGPHATGVFRVDVAEEDKPAKYWKRALHAYDFLQLNQTDRFLNDLGLARVVVGHNRWATQGGTSPDNNAHPFQVGPITLVHNGHVTNQYQLAPHSEFQHQVDSAYIAYALSKEEKDARLVLSKLRGAYALVWHDARTGKLHMARNKDRPLYWAQLGKDKDQWPGIAFASEYEMMASVLRRNVIPVHGQFMYPPEFNLVSWDLDDVGEYDMAEYEESKEVSYSSAPFPRTSEATQPTGGRGSSSTGSTQTTRGSTATTDDTKLTKAERKWKKRLEKDTPFKFRQRVSVGLNKWELYKNQRKLGFVSGTVMYRSTQYIVEVPSVSREEWESIERDARPVQIEFLNVRNSKKGVRTITGQFPQLENRENKGKVRSFVCGPAGLLIETEEWDDLVRRGCANCSQSLHAEDPRTIAWLGEQKDSPVCQECAVDLMGERQASKLMALN